MKADTIAPHSLLNSVLLGAGLFLLGAMLHLWLLNHSSGRIWGDEGDGLFNLWIMQHVYESFVQGRAFSLGNARIFWPDSAGTFFWSDSLLVPAIPFSVFLLFDLPPTSAFRLTGLVLSLLFYYAFFYLFYQIYALVRDQFHSMPRLAVFLPPVFAYLAFFSPGLLENYFQHFQNLSALWLVILVGAMVAYQRNQSRGAIVLMALCQTFLLFSAPYFAILGMLCLGAWLVMQLFWAPHTLLRTMLQSLVFVLPLLGLCALLAWRYMQTEHVAYPLPYINGLSVTVYDYFIPAMGRFGEFLEALGTPLPAPRGPAYPGLGLLLCFLMFFLWILLHVFSTGRSALVSGLLLTFLTSLLLIQLNIQGTEWFFSWYGFFFWPLFTVLCMWLLAKKMGDNQAALIGGLLVVLTVVVYGIAMGPHASYLDAPANPSPWGFFSSFAPGLTSIRAVHRFAVVAQGLLLALIFLCIMIRLCKNEKSQKLFMALICMVCLLQVIDTSNIKAYSRNFDHKLWTPSEEETFFLSKLDGVILFLPTNPFHRNTFPMLYFVSFPDLKLMNGYSGRYTDKWDKIMELGRVHGEGSFEQISYAESLGFDYIFASKMTLSSSRLKRLSDGSRRIYFENNQFLVVGRKINN